MAISSLLRAQNVSNVEAKQISNTIEINYTLDQLADISLHMSFNGGKSYTYTPRVLSGDIGKDITAGRNKIIWNWKNEGIHENMHNVCFKVIATLRSDLSKEIFSIYGVTFAMIKVEGGTFTMGATSEQGSDAESNEKPKHKVTLSDYYIGQTEVTQELWEAVMGTTIQQQRDKENRSLVLKGTGDRYPMYFVNLYECQQFVKALNSLLYNKLNGKKFALPTEAQWEFAARGGTKSNTYKYSGSNDINIVAWYSYNAQSSSHKVGLKAPNELGIYDMSGNVWEWCQDWYGGYKGFSQTNPTGSDKGNGYVYRGGSWYNGAQSSRVSYRVHDAGTRHNHIGFRLVLQ